jgi:thioredoxin 1
MKTPVVLTDKNFADEVEKVAEPVFVDFWSEWCEPCKIQGPIVDELADEYAGKIKIGKLEAGNNPEVPAKYQIMSIPALAIFKDGKIVVLKNGLQTRESLKKMIDTYLIV